MAQRPFIVVGDQTDHGGVVVEGSGMTDTHGKRIARVGDQVTCPKKGHGTMRSTAKASCMKPWTSDIEVPILKAGTPA